jgi:glycosyltransferase involved in cell wall biosynthesis
VKEDSNRESRISKREKIDDGTFSPAFADSALPLFDSSLPPDSQLKIAGSPPPFSASLPSSGSRLDTRDSSLPLSVYMITYNNGPTIERALQSVAGWAGEVVVVDSESTDGAIDTIRQYTDRLYQFETTNQREKYQRAQDYCESPWVLFIDADEWLTPEIKMEIEQVLAGGTEFDGFMVHRKNFYLGRVIEHGGWYPDHEIRLYRREKGFWEGGIHAKVHVNGKVGELKSSYMHTPYIDIAHQIRTVDRYSAAFAEDLSASGRSFHLFNLIGRPIFRFFRDYLAKGGFRDGVPGLIIAASTMYYVFMKHAKLWELERRNGRVQR